MNRENHPLDGPARRPDQQLPSAECDIRVGLPARREPAITRFKAVTSAPRVTARALMRLVRSQLPGMV